MYFIVNAIIGASVVGIAIGAVLYSRISRHYYIEIGTIPLAAFNLCL